MKAFKPGNCFYTGFPAFFDVSSVLSLIRHMFFCHNNLTQEREDRTDGPIDVIDVNIYTFALSETHPGLCQMPFGLIFLYVSHKPDNSGGFCTGRASACDLQVLLKK